MPIIGPRELVARREAAGHDVAAIEFAAAGHYDIADQPDYIARVGKALNRDR
ncbi:MAG: hypothetical protein AAGK23_10925 [Pseudomonadota bacterium]